MAISRTMGGISNSRSVILVRVITDSGIVEAGGTEKRREWRYLGAGGPLRARSTITWSFSLAWS